MFQPAYLFSNQVEKVTTTVEKEIEVEKRTSKVEKIHKQGWKRRYKAKKEASRLKKDVPL